MSALIGIGIGIGIGSESGFILMLRVLEPEP